MTQPGDFPFLSSNRPVSTTGYTRLVVHNSLCGRSSGSRIILPAAPSHPPEADSGMPAAFVPDYSGGPAPDSNGIPY